MSNVKLMLAHNYTDQNVNGWFLSEKLDGIRAYWNGHSFYSRTGKEIKAPKAFLNNMPKDIVLDGELCAGRGKFNLTSSIVRKTKDVEKYTQDWINNITYHVFDSPSDMIFEFRMSFLNDTIGTKYNNVSIVDQNEINKNTCIDTELKKIISLGGEGLMLRKNGSMYEHKRSKSLLKVKQFHDMEVKIVGYKNGTGKYKGMVGSFDCETRLGKTFNCGSGLTDHERGNPPSIGTFITVKYFEVSKEGIPRFPVFLRIAERQEYGN